MTHGIRCRTLPLPTHNIHLYMSMDLRRSIREAHYKVAPRSRKATAQLLHALRSQTYKLQTKAMQVIFLYYLSSTSKIGFSFV